MQGWKLGLKAVAIYRDGSKMLQPVSTKKHKDGAKTEIAQTAKPFRRRLPDTRNSITHKFAVGHHEGYLTVGLYEDGQPGELFITMAKEGSTVGGLMNVIGTCTSMALQYGVPLITLVDKFRHARFEPAGMTSNRDIPFAKSLIDYIFCWLGCQFLPGYAEANTPNRTGSAGENKNVTTARTVVEKTRDLAQKIAEVKAETKGAKHAQHHEKTGAFEGGHTKPDDDGSTGSPLRDSIKASRIVDILGKSHNRLAALADSTHSPQANEPRPAEGRGLATDSLVTTHSTPGNDFRGQTSSGQGGTAEDNDGYDTSTPFGDSAKRSAKLSAGGQLQFEAVAMQQFNAQFEHFQDDAPACDICGSITVRNGTCYKCFNCGNSMGCS
jgi:ribonucleoside-diphosphate reductase alpha chain